MLKHTVWAGISILSFVVSTAAKAADVGDIAPEIQAERWYNTSVPVSLAQLRGQVVVVEFWATYCAPCHAVQPKLAQIHRKWSPQGVVLISMSDESEAFVTPFIANKPATYIISAGGDTPRRFGIKGIPSAFVIDRCGVITWRGNPHDGGFEAAIERTVRTTDGTANGAGHDSRTQSTQINPDSHTDKRVEELEELSDSGTNRAHGSSAGASRSQKPFEARAAKPVKKATVAKKKPNPVRKAASPTRKAGKSAAKAAPKSSRKSGNATKSRKAPTKAKSARLVKKRGSAARQPARRSPGKRK